MTLYNLRKQNLIKMSNVDNKVNTSLRNVVCNSGGDMMDHIAMIDADVTCCSHHLILVLYLSVGFTITYNSDKNPDSINSTLCKF